jgi:hypothetical protein
MDAKNKPLFELPKLFTLDGQELTEDNLLDELDGDQVCVSGGGSGNTCATGTNE